MKRIIRKRKVTKDEARRYNTIRKQVEKEFPKKLNCEVETNFCSNELVARYGVNGSEKEDKTFCICGPCAVMLRRGGHKLKQV